MTPTKGERTRTRILDVAATKFATSPFAQVTTREIAAAAGCDPALIHRYFGSKEGLFGAVIDRYVKPLDISAVLADTPDEGLGVALVTYADTTWSSPAGAGFLALVARALSEDPERLSRYLLGTIAPRIAHRLGLSPAEGERRIGLCASQMLGLVVGRYLVKIPALTSLSTPELAAAIGPTLQRYLTGELPPSSPSPR